MKLRHSLLPLLFAGAASAQAPAAVQLQPKAELVVDGTSTVRDFSCRAKTLNAQLKPGAADASLALDTLAGAIAEVQLEVPIKDLDCANETMNEHMREALQAEKNPTIRLRVTGYEVGAAAEGAAPVKLQGELTIAGATKPVTLVASARPAADGTLHVEGRYALKMTDWGVKPPSLMLGTMKVRDLVHIRFDVALKQQ